MILFSGSKMKVKEIAKTLHQMGLSVGEMHSDLDQTQRNHVMHEFRNERVNILVATDIVSRGIDIDDITLMINFDVPYTRRITCIGLPHARRRLEWPSFVGPSEQISRSSKACKEIYRIPAPLDWGTGITDNDQPAGAPSAKGAGRGRPDQRLEQATGPRQEEGETNREDGGCGATPQTS